MRLTNESAKLLEAAKRELNLTEKQCEAFIERADELAQLDGGTRIEGRHMLQALAER